MAFRWTSDARARHGRRVVLMLFTFLIGLFAPMSAMAATVQKVVVRVAPNDANTVNNREMPDICLQHMVAVMLIDKTASFRAAHDKARMRDAAVLRLGQIASIGTLAYALGKMFLTGLGDLWGGRRNFLIGLGGATLRAGVPPVASLGLARGTR